MGYYTHYDISYKNEPKSNEYAKKLIEINPDYFGNYYGYIDSQFIEDLISGETMKWYDHDEDMIKLSQAFPDELFVLHGEGEGSGDLWNTYYKNGQMQHCPATVVYPEPDPNIFN